MAELNQLLKAINELINKQNETNKKVDDLKAEMKQDIEQIRNALGNPPSPFKVHLGGKKRTK